MQLKVLTYNIRYGLGIDGKVNLNRILEVLKTSEAHIVALNEVDKYRMRSRYKNQARWLAKRLEMQYRFAPAHRRYPGQTGNAILSKFPILKSEIIPLTSTGERRVVLKAVIEAERTKLTCLCTHLGLSAEERLTQVKELLKTIEEEKNPLILMGDFNALPESFEVTMLSQKLTDAMKDKGQATFPIVNPKARIDYIFISSNCVIINADIIKSEASDHLPLFAALEVK
jgi:endonuclease/exonuclease/phosphatase family metal-dependent hydrolase